jgi:hypothetical protein
VDILSVIFAKPEQKMGKATSIITGRKINARRALMEELCTIIFSSAQTLQQFIYQFKHAQVWNEYPNVQIGFAETGPTTTNATMVAHQHECMSPSQYRNAFKVFHYISNEGSTKHTELQMTLTQPLIAAGISMTNRCQIALNTLKKGRQEMNSEEFNGILENLCIEMNLQVREHKEDTHKRPITSIGTDDMDDNKNTTNTGVKGRGNSRGKAKSQTQDMETDK